MRENHLTWYEHVLRKPSDVVVRRYEIINVSSMRRGIGIPNKALMETINKYLSILNLTKHITSYRSQQQQKIHVADLK